MMFVLSPQLLLFGYVTWVWSLPPEPISLWEQQAKAWWVWVSLFCLIVVGTITGYVLLELHTSSVRRRHANSVWQSIKGQLRMELKESEQILAVNVERRYTQSDMANKSCGILGFWLFPFSLLWA
jgi:hypothetical protein